MLYFLLFLRGMAMGIADIIPGVSGGTIALIVGVYERLIGAISSCNFCAIQVLFRKGIAEFWKKIDGTFLCVLGSGILCSVIIFATLVKTLLESFPQLVWAFFFGLVLASIYFIATHVRQWNSTALVMCLIGIISAYILTTLAPVQLGNSWWSTIFAGALAICAMILPGISGSFILVILGKYEFILSAIERFDVQVIGLFVVGAVSGLLLFARCIKYMLDTYHDGMLSFLIGCIIGSIHKIWPWKIIGETPALTEINVSPHTYELVTQNPAFLLYAVLLMLAGFFLVFGLERVGRG